MDPSEGGKKSVVAEFGRGGRFFPERWHC
jgi:hypothetical protein